MMSKNDAILITSDSLGDGEAELGVKLMSNYLIALSEGDHLPSHVLLMNRGVFLAVEEAKTVGTLRILVEKGVRILACGTCLDYYNLKDTLAVGEVGNIYMARDVMAGADKVITLG